VARALSVRQTIVLDFAQLLLLAPALLICGFVWRRQHALSNLAGKPGLVDEHIHVGVAGRHPQTVPTRHGTDRVLRTALCLVEELLVVLIGRRKGSWRKHDTERGSVPAPERSALCQRNRRYAEHE